MIPSVDYEKHGRTSSEMIPGYSLESFPYAHCPEYIALSYVWGEKSLTSTIVVNGASVPILTNLAQALSSIREYDPGAYIWADSICINQQDDEEKSRLVQHMGETFANARLVYAWLGPIEDVKQDSSLEDLFTHLSDLGARFWTHAGGNAGGKVDLDSLDLDMILAENLDILRSRFAESPGQHGGFPTEQYASFAARPFWSRIWVLQEVFVAKSLYFICGNRRLTGRTLAGALFLLKIFQGYIVRPRENRQGNTVVADQPLKRFISVFSLFPEIYRVIVYPLGLPAERISLRFAMTQFCVKELPSGWKAMDPRDMIYGLLGFANDEESSYIRADYSKGVPETYSTVTRSLIRNGFTDVLAWAQPGVKKITDLPSWVPDYSSTIYESLCSQGQAIPRFPRFRACGATKYSDADTRRFDPLVLPVHGRKLDEVLSAGRRWFPRLDQSFLLLRDDIETGLRRDTSWDQLSLFLDDVRDLVRQAGMIDRRNTAVGQGGSGKSPRATPDAIWRVPCCDQVMANSGILIRGDVSTASHYIRTLRGIKALTQGPEDNFSAAARPYIGSLLCWAHKRPFLTASGFVGLGPAEVEPGDIVVILDGFNACYVFRGQDSDGRNEYRLVGEAYVDGVMDGEMANAAPDTREWFYLI